MNDATIIEKAVERLKTGYDPEIPVNVYDLGLIYKIETAPGKAGGWKLAVTMTLTAPDCPMAGAIPGWVHDSLAKIEDVEAVTVELTWDPPWDPSKMSEDARLALDMF